MAYSRSRARQLDTKQNWRVLFWPKVNRRHVVNTTLRTTRQDNVTDRMETKRWIERRYDARATLGRLAVTDLALHDEWLGNISHGREAGVGEHLFGVHCAEVVEDEGA